MTDHELAARLATGAGELLLDVRTELADARRAERKAAGDKRSHDFLMEPLAAERPDDAVLSEEGADNPVRLSCRAGMDRRPARRHPGVLRTRPRRLGGARRAVAVRRTGRRCGRPARAEASRWPPRRSPHHRPAPARRGSWCRAPGRRRSRWQCATRWTARWSKWARPERKSPPSCRARRRLRARRRTVRVGFRRAGRGGPRGRAAHLAHRRLAAGLQPARPAAARLGGLSPRIRRRGAGGHRVTSASCRFHVGNDRRSHVGPISLTSPDRSTSRQLRSPRCQSTNASDRASTIRSGSPPGSE